MAHKEVNGLVTIPSLSGGDLFPVYDVSEGGIERLKKITADNLFANITIPGDYITKGSFQQTLGYSASFDDTDPPLVIESDTVISQSGGVFKIFAFSEFEGVGSGEVRFQLVVDSVDVRWTQVLPYGNASQGNSSQFGAGTILYMMNTVQSTSYTIQLTASFTDITWSAQAFNRNLFTYEYVY